MVKKAPPLPANTPPTALERIVEGQPDVSMPATTKRKYLQAVRSFVAFAGVDPASWTYARAEDWRNALYARGLHAKSVNLLITGLRFASKKLARRGEGADFANLLEKIPVLKTDEDLDGRRMAIPEGDAERMISVCGDDDEGVRDRTILILGFRCGVRRAGICGIKVEDLRPDPKTGRTMLTITLKGRNRHRFEPDQTVIAQLEALFARLGEHGIAVGPAFWAYYGKPPKPVRPITTDMLYDAVLRRAAEAGVTAHMSPHVMRHSFVSYMVARGVPIARIQAITGQKSEAMIALYTTDLGAEPATSVLSERLK